MKTKHYEAATELSDQALLGVLGGCDETAPATQQPTTMAKAPALNKPMTPPTQDHDSVTVTVDVDVDVDVDADSGDTAAPATSTAKPAATPTPTAPPGTPTTIGKLPAPGATGATIPGATIPGATVPGATGATVPGATGATIPGATQPKTDLGGKDCKDPDPNPKKAPEKPEEDDSYLARFENALEEADEGYHEMVDGAKQVAHAVIDMIPEHGPIGTGLHLWAAARDRLRGGGGGGQG